MLRRIERLRVPGVFRDYSWPNDLYDFERYNVIYGWNGTGKTTIGRVLREVELERPPNHGSSQLRFEDFALSSTDFGSRPVPIRVFNKDFVEESVFRVDGTEMAPIYVLGRESAGTQQRLENLTQALTVARAQLQSKREQLVTAEGDLDRYCRERADLIRDTLRSAGSNPYNSFHKGRFREEAERHASEASETPLLTDQQRSSLLAMLQAGQKDQVPLLRVDLPAIDELRELVADLVEEDVVTSTIEGLRDDPQLAQWVHAGLELHQQRASDTCLYCEAPLRQDRVHELQAHFSTRFSEFMASLNRRATEIAAASRRLGEVRLPDKARLFDHLVQEYEDAGHTWDVAAHETQGFLSGLVAALNEKARRPFDKISFALEAPTALPGPLANLNAVLQQHNAAAEDFELRVRQARDSLADDEVARALPAFRDRVSIRDSARDEVERLEAGVRVMTQQVAETRSQVVAHRRPADELNADLRTYLGHDELQLEVRDNGYAVARNHEPASELSEGERTAIALLYFLKSLEDRSFDLRSGIVVLDDPVSSLDANALYLAFAYIKDRVKDAGQLLLLTHNFTLLRAVRQWLKHLPREHTRYFMLDCVVRADGRTSEIRELPQLLRRYESEYQYLFGRIYKAATSPRSSDLESDYFLPNAARRVLESFLAFRRPDLGSGARLHARLDALGLDDFRRARILRFLHVYSHNDLVGDWEHDPAILSETRAVLSDLLSLMRSADPEHVDAMVRAVAD